ncbi:GntR family transcriptional regulator [Nocardia barduliensis]|uniref:GntR family transcriptional regulator n=1 Tax=Nocardia barduliensis TaxID=2736643 RepID=UPI0015735EDA|nr:GntR family transcriptional regulator [Nocardia barduliensis]
MTENRGAVPKYLQISGHLRELIERGELAPGAEVPSERELAARWKVARPTAAKALNALRQEGIVRSRRGSGTYVAERFPLMRERVPRYGTRSAAAESVIVLATEEVEGPQEVTDALGLRAASTVLMRKTLCAGASGPTRLITCWFIDAARSEAVPGEVSAHLEAAIGRTAAVVRESVGARLATDDEGRHLELPAPSAVLVVHRTALDADGVALEYREIVHPPGHGTIRQEYSTSSAADFRR